MKSFLFLFSFLLLIGLTITGTSCQKETDCTANITCVDSVGTAVANATVNIFAQVKDPNDPKGVATNTADVKASGTTDDGGKVSFIFKLPAVFDVKATSISGAKTFTGTSIIKLEVGTAVEKTVILK